LRIAASCRSSRRGATGRFQRRDPFPERGPGRSDRGISIATDHLPGQFERLVDERSLLRREPDPEPHPPFILGGLRGAGPFRRLPQRADRFPARPRDPGCLGVALRHGKHGLGRADAHLARLDRGPQKRAAAQLPGKARHLLRGARVDPESLASIVTDARKTEPEHAVTDAERIESFADGDVHRTVAAAHPDQQRLDDAYRIVANGLIQLARQRPREHRCHGGERLEVAVGKKWRGFDHETIVAAPSDTLATGVHAQIEVFLRGLKKVEAISIACASGLTSAVPMLRRSE